MLRQTVAMASLECEDSWQLLLYLLCWMLGLLLCCQHARRCLAQGQLDAQLRLLTRLAAMAGALGGLPAKGAQCGWCWALVPRCW